MQSTASKKGSTSRVSGLLASLDLIAKASAELLCSSSNLESILPAILEIAQSLIAADGYAVWRIDESGAWSILASAGLSQSYAETVVANADIGKVSFPTSTVFIPNVFESELLTTRSRFHAAEHIQSLLLAPLLAGSNVIGTLVFYFRSRHECTEDEMHLATALANLTSSAFAFSALQLEQERNRRRSEFLAEASAVLSSSLDYEVTLKAVAQLAVPQIADWCAIDIYENDVLQRVSVAHADHSKLHLAHEYRRLYPPDLESPTGLGYVLRTGKPQFWPHVSDEALKANAYDERHLEILRTLGLQSFLIVALQARGRILGAFTLVTANRDLNETDFKLAEDLARRAAMAIENSSLFTALEQSERKFRTLADTIPSAIYIHDGTRPVYVNKAAEELSGYTAAELQNVPIYDLVHPDHREFVRERAAARLRGEAVPSRYEFKGLRKDGAFRWLDFAGAMVDFAGSPALLATAFDITERKLAEGQVERSEKELRLLTDILPALVSYVDAEEKLLRVNQPFEQWFGHPKAYFVGRTLREITGPNYHNIESHVKQVLRGEFVQFETNNVYADGPRHVLVTYVPDFDAARRVRGFAALVQDMTDRRFAEDALRKSEKLAAVGRLAASISHEINNPLESVTNLVFLAKNAPEITDRTRSFLSTAERELARVSQIATQTLRFYRQSSRPTRIDLRETVDSVVGLYEGRITNAQLEVCREYHDQPCVVYGLEGELRQVMANLLGNAIDATPAGGRIRLRITPTELHAEPAVRVTIADTGLGIEPALRARIFEPFFTTKATTGTGLGLWITREIIAKHRGTIRVRSRQGSDHHGTVFSFTVPANFLELTEQSA